MALSKDNIRQLNQARDIKAKYDKRKDKASKGATKRKAEATAKAKFKSSIKPSRDKFVWDDIELYKPTKGLEVIDQKYNLVADKEVGSIKLDTKPLEINSNNGDFMLLLRRVKTKQFAYAALTVTVKQILKARHQRLTLAHTGGDSAVASLIQRALGDGIDKRLKDPKKIIAKYKEDFLSVFSFEVILRDIDRILKNI